MPVILAIDPGTTRSAWVRYNSDLRAIHEADIAENETLRAHLDFCAATSDQAVRLLELCSTQTRL